MNLPRVFFQIALLALILCRSEVLAQSPAGTNRLFSGEELLRIVITNAFDAGKAYSGVVLIRLEDETMPMDIEMGVAAQDGHVRFYLDKTKVKGDPIFVEAAKMNLREGLAHVVTLFRKDDPARYTIFPDRRMFKHTAEPLSMVQPVDMGEPFHFEIAEAGTESFEGHDCRKVEVRGVTKKSSRVAATIWHAKDLEDAPVKAVLDMSQQVKVRMEQIKTARMKTNLFEVPTGYKEFKGSYYMPEFVTPPKPVKQASPPSG